MIIALGPGKTNGDFFGFQQWPDQNSCQFGWELWHIAGYDQQKLGVYMWLSCLQARQGALVVGSQVGPCSRRITLVEVSVAVATDDNIAHLGLQALTDMGNQWLALPGDGALVTVASPAPRTTGEYQPGDRVDNQ